MLRFKRSINKTTRTKTLLIYIYILIYILIYISVQKTTNCIANAYSL